MADGDLDEVSQEFEVYGSKPITVPDMLRESAKTYEVRNRLYGDNYKNFGKTMTALFPNGLMLSTPDDWNRIGILVQAVSKLSRFTKNFNDGHDDSLLDLSVYATMLRELYK